MHCIIMQQRGILKKPISRGVGKVVYFGRRNLRPRLFLDGKKYEVLNIVQGLRHGTKQKTKTQSDPNENPPLTKLGYKGSKGVGRRFPQGFELKTWSSRKKRAQQTSLAYMEGYKDAGGKVATRRKRDGQVVMEVKPLRGTRRVNTAFNPSERKDHLRGDKKVIWSDKETIREFVAPAWRMAGLGLRATRKGMKGRLMVFSSHHYALKAIYGLLRGISPLENEFANRVTKEAREKFDVLDFYFEKNPKRRPPWAEQKVKTNTGFRIYYVKGGTAFLEFNHNFYNITPRIDQLEKVIVAERLGGVVEDLEKKKRMLAAKSDVKNLKRITMVLRLRKLEISKALLEYQILQKEEKVIDYLNNPTPTSEDVAKTDYASDTKDELVRKLNTVKARIRRLSSNPTFTVK